MQGCKKQQLNIGRQTTTIVFSTLLWYTTDANIHNMYCSECVNEKIRGLVAMLWRHAPAETFFSVYSSLSFTWMALLLRDFVVTSPVCKWRQTSPYVLRTSIVLTQLRTRNTHLKLYLLYMYSVPFQVHKHAQFPLQLRWFATYWYRSRDHVKAYFPQTFNYHEA